MTYESVMKKYENVIKDAEYEIISTPKLGRILIATNFQDYSNPVVRIKSPNHLQHLIEERMHPREDDDE